MTDHEHDADFGASCPLPEPPKVLRMGKALTAVFEAFLERHMPGYNTPDSVSIQIDTTTHVFDELNGSYDDLGRFFLVDDGFEGHALNDQPEETE